MTPPAAEPLPPAMAPGMAVKTNTLAIVALILGLVIPPGGIIVGHIALSQIRKSREAGHGLALVGTVLGYVLTICALIFVVIAFAGLLLYATSGGWDCTSLENIEDCGT